MQNIIGNTPLLIIKYQYNGEDRVIYAKAELTMVDGIVYYELQKDQEMRQWVKKEKARLAAKMMEDKKKGMPLSAPVKQSRRHWHCDDIVVNE